MEITMRNPNQIEVLVPDNIKEIKDVPAMIMPIVLLLFFKT
jgi:hypothetical protein